MTKRHQQRSARLERGRETEHQFREWLNRSAVPYLATDQTPLTVPTKLQGEIKRPDFLVGIPTIGTLAFEVKSKSLYGDCLVFDTEERRRLRNFERFFNTTVWFACLDIENPNLCRLFLNEDLFDDARASHKLDRACVYLPICTTLQIDICTNALLQAVNNFIDLT